MSSPSVMSPTPSLISMPSSSSSVSSGSSTDSGQGGQGAGGKGDGRPLKDIQPSPNLASAPGVQQHHRQQNLHHQGQQMCDNGNNNNNNNDTESVRQAMALSFLSSCGNHQIQAVERLMALQFLVEHQLAAMPSLDHFFLGSKMFRLPPRRSAAAVACS
ncbi:hypothetical protein BC939DRAFT_454735 [Gamsiella multidivaricata]|uniref:uncharacterized protein n=1 Tax=Gamsiella multidivaricata TaxID=101098 RepID=UPI00221EB283|nr:uncharacterized protein BC939DRAFT_454735 [Gamsiella multidivaricata]KAI7821870.1 hypothetical protein BC939DRAFT_454735 [Gamsiella multidivaricata]